MTNIFVGNLSYQTTEEELQSAFSEYGAVDRVSVVRDRDTGQSRGFAFVEMANAAEANKAIDALNGMELRGRALKVNEARPREERSAGGGGGGRGFGGGGGGGRNRGGGGGGGYGSGGGGGRQREPRW
jgi:RNA recognition motif-containing protein